MRLLSVASVSYLSLANVMFDSVRHLHPEMKPLLLIPDVTPKKLKELRREGAAEIADLLCVEELSLDFLDKARGYYDALEFCSALKVLGSAHVLKSESECLFLDPDMFLLDRLDCVLQAQEKIVVTPHTLGPLPDDGAAPDDREMCAAGFVNGGVFRSRRDAPAIAWLASHTRSHWFVAPHLGMYADQQWLTALPFLFRDTGLLQDPGINVAYWNLHERPLRRDGGRIVLASGEPLALFHFSGFSRPSQGRLTKHSTRRYDPETEAILADLIGDYEKRVAAAASRWGHLKADIAFCEDPLPVRLNRAAKIWGESRLAVAKPSLKSRLRNLIRG